ncbi:glycosyltransferase family 4 protein [Flavobacteriaceae bacterium F89]|uniref:Glycosyltransferase family 4 protein n=1 Tax=Cerina litoralis TaxID=2874477 RepID=A0AAE3JRJ3_9FLAO|nr:glycosyltransferase family 4 protein [Cerina litoralis]MCG2459692.1 glycosyltransferase family 4 protein [Cerina litoralis]
MDKAKVLFIIHLPPPIHGAAMMGKFISQSERLNSSFECNYINLQTSRKLTDTGKGIFSKFFRFIALYLKVIYQLLTSRNDLCYMTLNTKGAAFYKEMLIVFLLKLFRQKIVYHFHNKGVSDSPHRFIDSLLYKVAFKNTRSILTSKFLYSDIKRYVEAKDVYYCHNGIPTITHNTISVRNIPNNSKRPKIIFLSNMIKEKGVWVLLEACEILYMRNVDFECHFVGSWADIAEVELASCIKDKKLSNHITIHGQKIGEEKSSLLKESNIFTLPTLNDCFPLVLLEAMQYALPIVATNEGGIPEIVDNEVTGFLIPKQNSKELANKLEMLILDPEMCSEMGEQGKNRFDEKFTLDQFEINLENILKNCISS